MTLHIANTRNNNATNTQMLRDLQPATANENAVTRLALDSFADLEAQRPGILHKTGKALAWTGAAVATVGVPLAGIYYGHQAIINGATNATTTVANAAINSTMTAIRTSPWSALPGILVGAGATVVAAKKAPRPAITMLALMGLTATGYVMNKTVGAATQSWTDYEDAYAVLKHEQHHAIEADLKTTYDGIASHMANLFDRAVVPLGLLQLKLDAEEIESKLPLAERSMRNVGLADAEAAGVLNQLKGTLRDIRDADIAFKVSSRGSDNLDVLAAVPTAHTSRIAIPSSARRELAVADANTLGYGFSAKKMTASSGTMVGTTTAISLMTAAGTEVASTLAENAALSGFVASSAKCLNDAVCSNETIAAAAVVGAAALTAGAFAAKYVYNRYQTYQDDKADIADRNRSSAIETLTKTYDAMATAAASSNSTIRSSAAARLPGVRAEMTQVGLSVAEQNGILENLERALAS